MKQTCISTCMRTPGAFSSSHMILDYIFVCWINKMVLCHLLFRENICATSFGSICHKTQHNSKTALKTQHSRLCQEAKMSVHQNNFPCACVCIYDQLHADIKYLRMSTVCICICKPKTDGEHTGLEHVAVKEGKFVTINFKTVEINRQNWSSE